MKNFYVDDLLKSVKTEKYAVDLIKRVKEMCAAGGFNLTKFICNRKNVLMSIPDIHRREGVKDADLVKEDLPTERALRVYWNVEKDALCFKVNLKEKPRNRRGILSLLSSFYDPLGLVSPFILKGKLILQELCQEGLHWDKQVSEEYVKKWEAWKRELYDLEKLSLGSCIKPSNFRKIVNISLHNFSDASEIGYGQCSYLRVVDENENIQCSLIMGKAKVAPKKFVSIPKLELVAAVLSVKTSNMIKKELQLQQLDEYFWTDSRVVLGYIANDTRAFKNFVANRVHMIQENSNVKQWKYVPSKENPADDASRGMNFKKFVNINRWFQGPKFLWRPQSSWETSLVLVLLQPEDPELKKQVKTNKIAVEDDLLRNIEEKYSCYLKMKRIIALMLKWKTNTEQKKQMMPRRSEKVLDFSINNLIY